MDVHCSEKYCLAVFRKGCFFLTLRTVFSVTEVVVPVHVLKVDVKTKKQKTQIQSYPSTL